MGRFRDGKHISFNLMFDRLTMLEQLGLPHARTGGVTRSREEPCGRCHSQLRTWISLVENRLRRLSSRLRSFSRGSDCIFGSPFSFRDVEDLLAERGITVSYETVPCWVNHFGPMIAADLRKQRPSLT